MNDTSLLPTEAEKYNNTAAKLQLEARSMHSVSKIVVKGAVHVAFFCGLASQLVVAGTDQDSISNINTRFEGDKLVIEQEGVSISGGGRSIHASDSGNIIAGGDKYRGRDLEIRRLGKR